MMDYWVSFARTGSPNGSGRPNWAPYSSNEAYMRFGDRPMPSSDMLPGMFELLEAWVAERRRTGGQWFLNAGVAAISRPQPDPDRARR